MPKKKQSNSADEKFSAIFKNVWFYVIVAAIAMGLFVWSLVPSWEQKNKYKIKNELDRIESLKENDSMTAYESWENIQSLIKGHKLTDIVLKKKLKDVSESINLIYPKVMDAIAQKNREQEDAKQKIAQEKRLAEKSEQLKKKYRSVDQSAKNALASLKRLAAYTEVGVTKFKYSEALGAAWGDIKIFVESPQGQGDYSELSGLLRTAISHYKDAADNWEQKYDLQNAWYKASKTVVEIDALLNQ